MGPMVRFASEGASPGKYNSVLSVELTLIHNHTQNDPCRTLRWCRNGHGGVSNHQPHHCLLNRLFGCRSKKTSKLRVTGLCAGIHRGPVNSPHKWPVTRKMFPFDDVIMRSRKFRSRYRGQGQLVPVLPFIPASGTTLHKCKGKDGYQNRSKLNHK